LLQSLVEVGDIRLDRYVFGRDQREVHGHAHQRRQQADDDQRHHQFDQREAAAARTSRDPHPALSLEGRGILVG